MNRFWLPVFAALIGFGGWNSWQSRSVAQPPGVLVAELPKQGPTHSGQSFPHGDYTIKPLATFALEARVLGRKDYGFGREAELSPVDLALGWGPMSDSQVLLAIDISQSGRFYYWHTQNFPIPRRQIEVHSANMHMIPADEGVRRQLLRVREGQVVRLEGLLVRVDADDGWHWQSSLTREDTGNGACELIWVTAFEIRG